VAEGVAEEVVEDEIVGGVDGHTGVVGRLYLVQIAEDVFGLVFVFLGNGEGVRGRVGYEGEAVADAGDEG